MQCPRCGSDHVELGSLIVARETQSVTGGGYVAGGGYVSTKGTAQTERAQALTADEPSRPLGGVLRVLLIAVLCLFPCGGICLSSFVIIGSTSPDPITGSQIGDVGQVPLLFWSLLAFMVIAGLGIILSLRADRRYRSRHQAWAIRFSRRFYCHNCGNIFQN